jgi:hypothetical protein
VKEQDRRTSRSVDQVFVQMSMMPARVVRDQCGETKADWVAVL